MRSQVRYALIVLLPLLLPACRQADGPVSAPDANVQGELIDVGHDLEDIARRRDPEAPNNLAEDLRRYARRPTAVPAVEELARRTAGVVAGSTLTEQAAQRLAHNLWLAVAARENSERQTETLQNDTQSLLMSIGIPEGRAQQVAEQVGEVQRAVNDRPRRWYELF